MEFYRWKRFSSKILLFLIGWLKHRLMVTLLVIMAEPSDNTTLQDAMTLFSCKQNAFNRKVNPVSFSLRSPNSHESKGLLCQSNFYLGFSLIQWFPNFSMNLDQLMALLKQIHGPHCQSLGGQEWDLIICISDKFPYDAAPRITLWKPLAVLAGLLSG